MQPDNTPTTLPNITLRDFFAGCAMAGLLASEEPTTETSPGQSYPPSDAAEQAYEFADAMLARREADKAE